ncbi:MAG: 1-acyl-sn-glycerol-3-phosphate acyltransferase [Clostridia bacterium]|nr:1-acyl-sn-glycerol-3-phosphate acyltransferase [Clostridia bacterium]
MTLLFSLIAAVSSVGIFYLTGLYTVWYYYFLPIVLFFPMYLAAFLVFVIFAALIGLFVNKKKPITAPHPFFYWVTRQAIGQLLLFFRVKVKVSGLEKLPEGTFVAVYNHRSIIDPFVLIMKIPVKRLVMISKPENEKIPVAGKYMHMAGFLTIDRKSPMKARSTVEKSAEWIREGIASVAISPEGTRSKSGKLLPFRAAPFSTARKANAPIAVITMTNTEKVFKRFPWRSTTIALHVVGSVMPDRFDEMNSFELSNYVRQMMLDDLGEEDSTLPPKSADGTDSADSE